MRTAASLTLAVRPPSPPSPAVSSGDDCPRAQAGRASTRSLVAAEHRTLVLVSKIGTRDALLHPACLAPAGASGCSCPL